VGGARPGCSTAGILCEIIEPRVEELFCWCTRDSRRRVRKIAGQRPGPDRGTRTCKHARAGEGSAGPARAPRPSACLPLVEQQRHQAVGSLSPERGSRGRPAAHGQAQHFLRPVGHAVQVRVVPPVRTRPLPADLPDPFWISAAPAGNSSSPAADDLAEDAAVLSTGARGPHARHLDGVVLSQLALCALPNFNVDLSRLLHRRAQAHRDVVGQVIAAQRMTLVCWIAPPEKMPGFGWCRRDVHQGDASSFSLLGQNRFRRRERARERCPPPATRSGRST